MIKSKKLNLDILLMIIFCGFPVNEKAPPILIAIIWEIINCFFDFSRLLAKLIIIGIINETVIKLLMKNDKKELSNVKKIII